MTGGPGARARRSGDPQLEREAVAGRKNIAARQRRIVVFIDDSDLSERPCRERTSAPKGQTPVLQYRLCWKQLLVIAGVSYWRYYFRFFAGSIKSPQIVQFLNALQATIGKRLLIVWDRLLAHRSWLVRYAHQLMSRLRERDRDLERRLRDSEVHDARRIAADLHDGLGQDLTGIGFALAAVRPRLRVADSGLDEDVGRITAQISDAIRRCRGLAYSQAAFAAQEYGLIRSLRLFCTAVSDATGLPVSLTAPDDLDTRLDPRVAHHLLRIAQEAVTNARRQSGASRVSIVISERSDVLAIRIEDDGSGLPAPTQRSAGVGINSMQFRADEIGAQIALVNRPTGGHASNAYWPLAAWTLERVSSKPTAIGADNGRISAEHNSGSDDLLRSPKLILEPHRS